MSISANSIIDYVQFENLHPRLISILRNNIHKYYFSDMNAAIAAAVRLNQYLNFGSAVDDLFMIKTKFKSPTNKSIQYNTNKGIVNLFLENESYLKYARGEIINIGAEIQSFERGWVSGLPPVPTIGDMVSVDCYINGLRKQVTYFEEYQEKQKELTSLAGERLVCSSNRRSYLRAFEFDCELMYDTLCDDVIGVIREFVGEEFLESVRRKTISNKYFPAPRKDSVVRMLDSWHLSDLKQYSKHMYIAHEFRWVPRVKNLLIERIISRKLRFFELHRDIICLTKALNEKRERERQLRRAVARDRAAALALKPQPLT
jgi:hypothetical protein